MADYINNIAAGDSYTAACTLGPSYDAKYAVITIANNPALMQFAIGHPGNWRWTDEREFQSIPQSFRVGNIVGVRIRNATPGQVARVMVVLAGDDDPDFASGMPFSGVLTASGGVSPGGGSVEVDHNGVAISTEPKLDFEDAGANLWVVTDDPTNTRAKITPPKALTGRINPDGTIAAGTGFTCARLGVGAYKITYTVAFAAPPTVQLTPILPVSGNYPLAGINSQDAGQVTVNTIVLTTQATVDCGFNFWAFATA